MMIEGCDFDDDADRYAEMQSAMATRWNGYTCMRGGESLAHLIQGRQPRTLDSVKHSVQVLSGSVGASAEGKTSADGNSTVTAEAHIRVRDDDGGKVTVTAEVEIQRDSGGQVSSSGGIKNLSQ
ncbi:MAG: hypothetical protein KGR16_02910 [Verrucomicrobia bacterium]|nr:hypothetical protein [Verrucomicrobiota bacterium]